LRLLIVAGGHGAFVAAFRNRAEHVTVMFCDLVDSTGIAAKVPEEWRDLVGAYIDAASAAVVDMGGHLNTGP
jgi:class 3 adenylate cyclase